MKNIDLSIVIPLYNEDESLPELAQWIDKVCIAHNIHYEVIMVDDGSKDKSWKVIENLSLQYPNIRGIKFRRNYGKSAALNVGFEAAKGDVIITMDADLQDSPEEIPGLMAMINDEGYDMVSGWKKKRYDPLTKTIPTKLFNAATRRVSGIKLNDFNCGLKAYKNEVVKSIEVYGEMHRYIPLLAKWSGFDKIGEKAVSHQERKYGTTKFGFERFINGFLDLLSISFVGKFGKRPMHFFGTFGLLSFFLGFIILFYLSYIKLVLHVINITDRPLFFFGIVLLIVGAQLFLTGFIAELITRNASGRNHYLIEKELNME
jgi:glycosyltransferase involved in cell wall biosynthesis